MNVSLHSDKLPQGEEPQIRVMAMPADTNASGDIFGGWLMSQVDIAGSVAAYRRAHGRIVTIAVNEFRFLKPVYVGDLVSLYSRVINVGNTSIRVMIEGYAERSRGTEECDRVAEAEITYVAIDKDGKPRPVEQ
ncbi:MAG: acyl-CoA thioesterase [Thiohalophilus sp.]|jgi:acyl-CoA thioesterase YciA